MQRVAMSLIVSAAALGACAGAMAQEGSGTASPAPAAPEWSWPGTIENAQVLPADIGADRIREVMQGFTAGLGVRCSYCHVPGEGGLEGFDFASDANPRKNVARAMMRMTHAINTEHLSQIAGHEDARATCYTCHRGAAIPVSSPPPESE